jgi:hypothetical protein
LKSTTTAPLKITTVFIEGLILNGANTLYIIRNQRWGLPVIIVDDTSQDISSLY